MARTIDIERFERLKSNKTRNTYYHNHREIELKRINGYNKIKRDLKLKESKKKLRIEFGCIINKRCGIKQTEKLFKELINIAIQILNPTRTGNGNKQNEN
jgi:hypothetical protein